ncbi:aminopeptidase [Candidatus Woesearchaeota archaeon]|nr:aminopeptidase [Candidatus Woesearchaeota archaeon]
MNSLGQAIESVFSANLAVRNDERVLILTDKDKRILGGLFFDAAKLFAGDVDIIEIPVGKINGEEPPPSVAERMLDYDVQLLVTSKSLTHTDARKKACMKGARIATLPDTNEDMLKRALNVDYGKMHDRIRRISDRLDSGRSVTVRTGRGTDISFSIGGRKAHGRNSGIFTEKGRYGNLPDGESFIAPAEGSAEGVFIIDGSVGGIGMVDEPIRVYVKKGYAERIEGGKAAERLKDMLTNVGRDGRNIAEFGMGANDKAKITGNLLEDEKVLGTAHIALGNNSGFGGNVNVALHIDGLIDKPDIIIDGGKIMEEGRLTI